MTSLDILNLSFALGFLIIAGFFAYASYHLVQTLKSTKKIIDKIDDITKSLEVVKEGIKLGLASVIGEAVAKLKKGGEEKWRGKIKEVN